MNWRRRAFDIVGAVGGLLFFGPVMGAVALAILADDGPPILFRQPRLGRARRPFEILKFRSMRDGRVTRAGRVLRQSGLDELPQFVNILRGELSAVGPRPVTAADARRYEGSASATLRWTVNPGLTGLAQLAAGSLEESIALDCEYVRKQRLALDCRLIAMSFVVNVLGKSRTRRLFFGAGG